MKGSHAFGAGPRRVPLNGQDDDETGTAIVFLLLALVTEASVAEEGESRQGCATSEGQKA